MAYIVMLLLNSKQRQMLNYIFFNPHKEIDKGALKSLRRFLINSGVHHG
jgi:hypothetical protein